MPNTLKSVLVASTGEALSAPAREGLHWSLGLLDHKAKGYPTPPTKRARLAQKYSDLILVESDHTVCEVLGSNFWLRKSASWLVDNIINRLFGTKVGHVPYIRSRTLMWHMVTSENFVMWSSLWGVEDTQVLHFSNNERADAYAARLAEDPNIRYWHFRLS